MTARTPYETSAAPPSPARSSRSPAAVAINHRDAETIRREAGVDVVSGPTRALNVIRCLHARADRVAGGAT